MLSAYHVVTSVVSKGVLALRRRMRFLTSGIAWLKLIIWCFVIVVWPLDNFSILLLNFRDREETPLSLCYDKCLATTVDIWYYFIGNYKTYLDCTRDDITDEISRSKWKRKINLPPVIVEHPGARKNSLEHVHEKGRTIKKKTISGNQDHYFCSSSRSILDLKESLNNPLLNWRRGRNSLLLTKHRYIKIAFSFNLLLIS